MTSFPDRAGDSGMVRLRDLADLLGLPSPPSGGDTEVRRVTPARSAGANDLGLVADARYLGDVESSGAAALLVARKLEGELGEDPRPRLVVENPHAAMRRIIEYLHPELPPEPGVHPTAIVDPSAELGQGVTIGPFVIIERKARVGARTRVGAHVVIGAETTVGEDVVLYPHVVLYPAVEIGARVAIHAGARIGVDGFGFVLEDGEHRRIPHLGGCVIEDDVEIGANVCIDRGSIAETRVGAGTKIDNLVQLGHNVTVGPKSLLVAQVGVAGSSSLGAGVIAGGQAGVAGHLAIGDGAVLAAQAGIIGDVPPGETVMGFPARPRREFLRVAAAQQQLPGLIRRIRAIEKRLDDDSEPSGDGTAGEASG